MKGVCIPYSARAWVWFVGMTQSLQERWACAHKAVLISFVLYYHNFTVLCFCDPITETKSIGHLRSGSPCKEPQLRRMLLWQEFAEYPLEHHSVIFEVLSFHVHTCVPMGFSPFTEYSLWFLLNSLPKIQCLRKTFCYKLSFLASYSANHTKIFLMFKSKVHYHKKTQTKPKKQPKNTNKPNIKPS